MQIYLVGGAVRDRLLGITSKDKDWVVVGATPGEMIALGYQQVGADFPVFLHPETKEEYALARTERKSGQGYQGFVCDFSPEITLEDDLQRRDLTINAMAIDENGDIVDPFHGQLDLQEKLLRHVSPAFSEDPLRVLRVARFSTRLYDRGFRIAPATLKLMQQIAQSGELACLTPERVWQETARALSEAHPQVYFQTLAASQSLAHLFPELADLFGVQQSSIVPPDSEAKSEMIDAGEHALHALAVSAGLSANIDTRFAALMHGVGLSKTAISSRTENTDLTTIGKELIETLCRRLKTPKSTRELAVMVVNYRLRTHLALQLSPEEIVSLFDDCDVWRRPERFSQFLLACEAEAKSWQHGASAPYQPKFLLTKAEQLCRQIDTKSLLDKGYQGIELKQQIRLMRANKIRAICD